MGIPFRIRYKNYTYAPKATGASKRLGALFAWPVLVILAVFWFAIIGALLDSLGLASSDSAYGIALVSLLPAGFALFKWKKWKTAKIDQAAMRETQFMLSMPPIERQKYEEKLMKDAMRILWLVVGGFFLLFAILFLYLWISGGT